MDIKTIFAGFVVMIVSTLVVAAIGWGVGGVGTPADDVPEATPEPENVDETFYIVAYHWDWAFFTEDGTELDKIRVREGTVVEIYAVNVNAQDAVDKLPAPVAEKIRDIDWNVRTTTAMEAGLLPLPEEFTISEHLWPVMEDHGFLISWHGVAEYLDDSAQDPTHVVITARRPGEYELVCTNYCGLGHNNMNGDMFIVE